MVSFALSKLYELRTTLAINASQHRTSHSTAFAEPSGSPPFWSWCLSLKRWCIFVKLSPLIPKTPPAFSHKTHPSPPQLILAGAGTGKTTTITAKIAYMVEKENIDPSQILALTFSKEAARNMRENVEKIRSFRERK